MMYVLCILMYVYVHWASWFLGFFLLLSVCFASVLVFYTHTCIYNSIYIVHIHVLMTKHVLYIHVQYMYVLYEYAYVYSSCMYVVYRNMIQV